MLYSSILFSKNITYTPILKVWRLHAALFGIYYFSFNEQAAEGLIVINGRYLLTNLDAADVLILMKGSWLLVLTCCGCLYVFERL